MNARKWIAALILLVLSAAPALAEVKTFTLFGGGDISDTTQVVSPWIPVRHANRIVLRTWSTHAAFSATGVDSVYTDSISVFKVGFSDSVSGYTSGSYYPIAQDSVVITSTVVTNVDSTAKLVAVSYPPLQEALRAPANGSGIYTYVYPVQPGPSATAVVTTAYGDGSIEAAYMRVYITSALRNRPAWANGSVGRAGGFKGLRMTATVFYQSNNR